MDALQNEATQHYLRKEFGKAADAYDQALRTLPESSSERVEYMQKKAFCYLSQKK